MPNFVTITRARPFSTRAWNFGHAVSARHLILRRFSTKSAARRQKVITGSIRMKTNGFSIFIAFFSNFPFSRKPQNEAQTFFQFPSNPENFRQRYLVIQYPESDLKLLDNLLNLVQKSWDKILMIRDKSDRKEQANGPLWLSPNAWQNLLQCLLQGNHSKEYQSRYLIQTRRYQR